MPLIVSVPVASSKEKVAFSPHEPLYISSEDAIMELILSVICGVDTNSQHINKAKILANNLLIFIQKPSLLFYKKIIPYKITKVNIYKFLHDITLLCNIFKIISKINDNFKIICYNKNISYMYRKDLNAYEYERN